MFFNLDLLEKEAGDKPEKFLKLLELAYSGKPAKSRTISYVTIKNIAKGFSWLLNPSPIFTSEVDLRYRVQYVKLAARRDYTQYKLYGYKALDSSYFPELNLDSIKHNPLLKIAGKHILFKFEEQYGTSIR